VHLEINEAKKLTIPAGGKLSVRSGRQRDLRVERLRWRWHVRAVQGPSDRLGVAKSSIPRRGHINSKEAKEGYRLSCQVAVKQDMKLEVPPRSFRDQKVAVYRLAAIATWPPFIKELVLELPVGEEVGFKAGGYIQIEAPPHVGAL
jgi:Na+-transporting NADH:ubiquinone oxidoreductase subunit F